MDIYIVMWDDKHADTTAKVFRNLNTAKNWIKESIKEILYCGDEIEESVVAGWEWYCVYGGENSAWIIKDKLN